MRRMEEKGRDQFSPILSLILLYIRRVGLIGGREKEKKEKRGGGGAGSFFHTSCLFTITY